MRGQKVTPIDEVQRERARQVQGLLERVMELEGPKRVEALLETRDPGALVRAMPEVDFYLTVKEVGSEDAIALLKLASPSQWQHLMDMELWKKDRIHPPSIGRWIKVLLSCGWDCVHRWMVETDPELLVLILKKEIKVFIKDEGWELPENDQRDLEDLWTLDDVYYISFRNPNHQEDIRTLLQILAEEELDLYRRILENVYWLVDAEVEEEAYRFRSARLQDQGIFPFEESISVYQYLPRRRIESLAEGRDVPLVSRPTEDLPPPSLPLILSRGEDLVGSALKAITDRETVDRIKVELASLGNQLMVADLLELRGRETLREVLEKAKCFLHIALERLGTDSPSQATQWLRRLHLKVLFQIGFSAFLERSWRAKRIWKEVWNSPLHLPRRLLGSPWEDMLKGLEQRPPVHFDESTHLYRPPRNWREIQALDEQLDHMETAGHLVQALLGIIKGQGQGELLELISVCQPISLDWRCIALTSFVQWSNRGVMDPLPLNIREVQRFQTSAWEEGPRTSLKGPLKERWMESLRHLVPVSPAKVDALASKLLGLLEEELGQVAPGDLDERYIPWLIINRAEGPTDISSGGESR